VLPKLQTFSAPLCDNRRRLGRASAAVLDPLFVRVRAELALVTESLREAVQIWLSSLGGWAATAIAGRGLELGGDR